MAVDVRRLTGVPLLIGALMVAATVAFVWGAFAERSGHSETHAEKTTVTTPTTRESSDQHAGESGPSTTTSTAANGESPQEHAGESGSSLPTTVPAAGESPAQHAAESAPSSTPAIGEAGHAEYHPLGVNLESTPLVVAAALFSLVLAAAVAMRPRREVLALIVVAAAAFAALEVVEIAHQASQSRPGLVALAATAGVLHAAVALVAAFEVARSHRTAFV